jgi:hypothetical protein
MMSKKQFLMPVRVEVTAMAKATKQVVQEEVIMAVALEEEIV